MAIHNNIPVEIGLALRQQHNIDIPELFQEPDYHDIHPNGSCGYGYEQFYFKDSGMRLTTFNEYTMQWWDLHEANRTSDATKWLTWLMDGGYWKPMEKSWLAGYICFDNITYIVHSFYNSDLLVGSKIHNGCKTKTAKVLGFENWASFKAAKTSDLPLKLTNATT